MTNTAEICSYGAAHARLKRRLGRAANYRCSQCGSQAAEWAYDNASPDELVDPEGRRYTLDVSHYLSMCRPCHKAFDMRFLGKARCGTKTGYYRHRNDGEEACADCRAALATYTRELRRSKRITPLEETTP